MSHHNVVTIKLFLFLLRGSRLASRSSIVPGLGLSEFGFIHSVVRRLKLKICVIVAIAIACCNYAFMVKFWCCGDAIPKSRGYFFFSFIHIAFPCLLFCHRRSVVVAPLCIQIQSI